MSALPALPARRFVRALLVALLVFLVLGGGAGFAMAATQEPGGNALRVPLPRPGDTAVYGASQVILDRGLAKPGLGTPDEVRMTWLPARIVYDAESKPHIAAPLHVEYQYNAGTKYEITYRTESAYDTTTGQALVMGGGVKRTTSGNGCNGCVAGIGNGPSPTQIDYTYSYLEGQLGPCAQRTSLQGAAYVDGEVVVQGNCDWRESIGSLHGIHDQLHYRSIGWNETSRGRMLGFEAQEDKRLHFWVDEASPFPVRVQTPMTDIVYSPYTYGRFFDLQLRSYTPGQGAYPTQGDLPQDLGVPATSAWNGGVLDESGVEVAFPMATAFKAMADQPDPVDPTAPQSYHQFVARHPEAYLAVAWEYQAVDRNGQTHYQWAFVVTDGNSELDKYVTYGPHNVRGIGLPTMVGAFPEVGDYARADTGFSDLVFPARTQAPASFPRVADLLARFAALVPGQPPAFYGFMVSCDDSSCARIDAHEFAGRNQGTLTDAIGDLSPGLQATDSVYQAVAARPDGKSTVVITYTQHSDGLLSSYGAAPATQDGGPLTAKASNAVWLAPSAPAAAGVGVFALLAGLAYYFWPAVRGLPVFGLFSRIQTDRVAEHPARARILELVAAEPGIHHKEVGRRLGIGQGTLDHHARKLEKAGLLVRRSAQGYTCYFLRLGTDRHVMAASPAVKSEGGRKVLAAVAARPDSTYRALAEEAGLSSSTVEHHLKRLREAGLVESGAIGVRLSAVGEKVRAVL